MYRFRLLWTTAGILAVLGPVLGCDSPTVPGTDPLIDGVILELLYDEAQDPAGIYVKEDPADPAECGYILGLSRAELRRRSLGFFAPIGPEELAVGDSVRVWHWGGIFESCPAGTGAAVVVVDG